jgi:hypothetical protein
MNAMDKLTKKQESALREVETAELQAVTGGSATGGAGSGKAEFGSLSLPVEHYQLVSTVSNLLQVLH